MKAKIPRRQPWCIRLAAAFMLALPVWTHAQAPFPTPTPTPNPLAGVSVQVLDQQQVTIGRQTITYNRIAPPVFPPPTPTPAPSTAPVPQIKTAVRTVQPSVRTQPKKLSRKAQDASADDGGLPFNILSASITVYDHQFSEVSWTGSAGNPGLRVFVNMDFNYLANVGTIQTSDAAYELIVALSNDTAASLIQAGQQPPNLASFPAGSSSYQVIAGNPANYTDDLAALSAFLAYYDANQAQLMAAYQQQQAAAAAQQLWLQTHPSVPPNTVINYWPVKSKVYLPSGH